MRRMNSMLLGHHGASGRTDCMYLRIASCARGIVPGKRQVHDARGYNDVVEIGDAVFAGVQRFEQVLAAEEAGIVVDVQRPHAWGDVDNSGQAGGAQLLFQRVDTKAEIEVEHIRAVFHQQIAVAVGAA